MSNIVWINPDHFLDTNDGRVWTPERDKAAWEQSYMQLADALLTWSAPDAKNLYIVCGVQASGKSTWIESNRDRLGRCIIFDAALPRAIHRKRIIEEANGAGFSVHAVYLHTTLERALARNGSRREDIRVPDRAIISVMDQIEPPALAEGFDTVDLVST